MSWKITKQYLKLKQMTVNNYILQFLINEFSFQILSLLYVSYQKQDQCIYFQLDGNNDPVIYLNDKQTPDDCQFKHQPKVQLTGATARIMDRYFKMYEVVKQQTDDLDLLYTSNLNKQNFKKDNKITISQIPGYSAFTLKNNLGQNIMKYKEQNEQIPIYIPQTFTLPQNKQKLIQYAEKNQNSTYILKNPASSRGRDMQLFPTINTTLINAQGVVQQYINNPLLIQGYKFDMRIYFQCQDINPLICYIYPEGLARLATNKYQQLNQANSDNFKIHLTNFAINKQGVNQIIDLGDKIQSKMSLTQFIEYAVKNKYIFTQNRTIQQMQDEQLRQFIKQQINDCLYYSLLALEPEIVKASKHTQYTNVNKYFGLYGADLMFDQQGNIYLIEINLQPALGTSTPIDKQVKQPLVIDMMNLAQIKLKDQKHINKIKKHNKQKVYEQQQKRKEIIDKYNLYLSKYNYTLNNDDQHKILQLEDQFNCKGHFELLIPRKQQHQQISNNTQLIENYLYWKDINFE